MDHDALDKHMNDKSRVDDSEYVPNGIFPNGVYDCRQCCNHDDYGPYDVRKKYELDLTGLADVKFGKEMKDKEFALRRNNIFFNNGSYGAVPLRIMKLQNDYIWEREDHPDLWFRYSVKAHLDKARESVAEFINAPVDNVVLVPNVTSGLNVFIKEYPFNKGDAILDTDKTFGSISYIVNDLTTRLRPDVERVHMQIPFKITSEEQVVDMFKAEMEKHPNIKVAVVDHITSPSSMVLPLKKIIDMFHSYGVFVFVDGAHATGQIPLDMADLNPDCYTGNFHKWGFTPRGCAVVYFAEKHRLWVRPPVTSWHYHDDVDLQFLDQGCRDHAPLICVRHGVEFINALGGVEKLSEYTRDLADKGQKLVADSLGLEMLKLPESMIAPNLRMIKLPPIKDYEPSMANVWILQKELFGKTNIYGLLLPVEDSWYLRLSVSIYNSLEEFEAVAEALQLFLQKFSDISVPALIKKYES